MVWAVVLLLAWVVVGGGGMAVGLSSPAHPAIFPVLPVLLLPPPPPLACPIKICDQARHAKRMNDFV